MGRTRNAADDRPRRLLDWRSGGWLILLAVVLGLVVSALRVVPLIDLSNRAVGDGRRVETYGFDLTHARLPREALVATGFSKDGVPALTSPRVIRAEQVPAFNETRDKYLVSGDRVIGVSLNGESRAYPIRVLNWHEVVNDTLGGLPIAVTYHPLCDSVAVFDRRVGSEVLEFGVSGLLYNSNLLMYDRRPEGRGESLWSQLRAAAVAGPAAEQDRELELLPASLTSWESWTARHPGTTVLEPDMRFFKRYERNPYGSYFRTRKLRFPVEPLPPEVSPSPWSAVIVVQREVERSVVSLENLTGTTRVADLLTVERRADRSHASALIDGAGDARVIYSLWFAWYAQHPDTALDELRRPDGERR